MIDSADLPVWIVLAVVVVALTILGYVGVHFIVKFW